MSIPTLTRRAFLLGTAALTTGCLKIVPRGHIRLAAGDPGGLYLAFSQILAEQLHRRYPGVDVKVVPTAGSVENLALLRSGAVDMGLALADVAERDRATGPLPTAPSAVARVYENYLQVIVPDASPVQHVSDLAAARVSIGPDGSGASATSRVLLTAAGLDGRMEPVAYRLRDALAHLAENSIAALVWSGGVPTPAIAELDAVRPLRILDIGGLSRRMSELSGYPYVLRPVPTCGYVPFGIRSIGVANLLLCRQGIPTELVSATVDTLASEAEHLVPPYIRGLQYLDTPSMIQTGFIPLHSGAVEAYRELHG
ncbi:TRAP transporter solute receptor, TAXI family [Mycolicibacterium rhodesiae JS60]|nr:TRAP transporter solute receptor, TAXI family [Mycolicibacterium rhodesiae JS60]